MNFGQFIKECRLAIDLSLRKFCELAELDPSNWSKVERDMMPLSLDNEKLTQIAEDILHIERSSASWVRFFDLASIAKKKIPDYVYSNEEVINALPIFFRTASKDRPTEEELNKLIELIKRR